MQTLQVNCQTWYYIIIYSFNLISSSPFGDMLFKTNWIINGILACIFILLGQRHFDISMELSSFVISGRLCKSRIYSFNLVSSNPFGDLLFKTNWIINGVLAFIFILLGQHHLDICIEFNFFGISGGLCKSRIYSFDRVSSNLFGDLLLESNWIIKGF